MYTYIDLFAGCGGFSVGFSQAGFTPIAKVEIDEWACQSLRANFPNCNVIQADIRTLADADIVKYRGVDVIIGGPPCQGFSVAGSTQYGITDPRNELFLWFVHWIWLLKPAIAIMENVPNILNKRTTKERTAQDVLAEYVQPLGYAVKSTVLNAADFGVPQLRRRAFIVAHPKAIPFSFPLPTHQPTPGETGVLFPKPTYTTVGDALSDLPSIEAGEGTDDESPYAVEPRNDYQRELRHGSAAVTNHIAMKHTDRLVERFKIIPPGKSLKDVPLTHGQIAKLTGETVSNPFKYNNYRLDETRPALAIPASFQSLFLHPEKHRNLTAREAARLMGFPDNFRFQGKRTTMSWEKHLSQYNQIGNAVCPPVARALAEAVSLALKRGAQHNLVQLIPSVDRSPLSNFRIESLPVVDVLNANSECRIQLRDFARSLIGDRIHYTKDIIKHNGIDVPIELISAAIAFIKSDNCPVCSRDMPPFTQHKGTMHFLISKDDISTLRSNKHDHGLDYHLRSVFGINHQVGHAVGELLENLGIADIHSLENVRTGRKVRSVCLRTGVHIPAKLKNDLFSAISQVHSVANSAE